MQQELACPTCHTVVAVHTLVRGEHQAHLSVSHAQCPKCSHAYMVLNAADAQTTLMLSTELTQDELRQAIRSGEPVSSDYLLALHSLLAERHSTRYLSQH